VVRKSIRAARSARPATIHIAPAVGAARRGSNEHDSQTAVVPDARAASFLDGWRRRDSPPSKYLLADHYWAMSIDIGSASAAATACALCEGNGVPQGYFRTGWSATRSPVTVERPEVDSPTRIRRIHGEKQARRQELLRAKLCKPVRHSPCVQVCRWRDFETPTGSCWSTKLLPRLPLLRAACPMAAATSTGEADGRQVHSLLPPHQPRQTTAAARPADGARTLAT